MYYVDANLVMNVGMVVILISGACVAVLALMSANRPKALRVNNYLTMLAVMFVCFGLVVAVMGFRGRKSADRPWTFFLDMKYQPKYTAQGESRFFSDGRESRLPPEHVMPFDGTTYFADAGRHTQPDPAFLRADLAYDRGIADLTAINGDLPVDPKWENGKPTPGYFVLHIPAKAVDTAGGWERLLSRGREQFNMQCSMCHGRSGRGGQGVTAYGIVGVYGLSVAPANLTAAPFTSQPDGQLYHTIANGKNAMPAYGHQVNVQDRWAIVAHIRALQFAHNPPGGK